MTKDANTSNDRFSMFKEDELNKEQQAFVQGGKNPNKFGGDPNNNDDKDFDFDDNEEDLKVGRAISELKDNEATRKNKDLLRCTIETSKGGTW